MTPGIRKFVLQALMLEENAPQVAANVVVGRMVVVRLASWFPAPHPVLLLLKLLHQAVASLQMHLVPNAVMAPNVAQL